MSGFGYILLMLGTIQKFLVHPEQLGHDLRLSHILPETIRV